ncbi:hypothetical protein BOTBODRAFT_189398 [Botryobasidium botryosum FD-172 SS1]|uniref:Lysine-specific metallo-endopeptidase domain-containing protein n=1 Tax=Botryobasidium botryosum (strain FD-172 SS1) TaxID=930990 RepID=A0A067MKL9_BOTB1|nr:hypothetical protein BOTBODRAFT_189398 [Botryobasidium botryosum FD-172 SS1]
MRASVAIALASALAVSAERRLSLEVNAPASVLHVDNLSVKTTITNTGDETVKLLNDPRSPLSTWNTDTFSITNGNGATPNFTGVKVRYIPEVAAKLTAPETFTVLAPGQSVDVTHNLAGVYNFTAPGAGAYTFEPANLFSAVNADGSISTIYADTTTAESKISGKLAASVAAPTSSGHLGSRATYNSCSSTRQTQIASAISSAQSYTTESLSALNASPSGTRYVTWFGTYTASRYNSVKSAFTNISGKPTGWKYDCTCTDSSTYAYVYPSQYGTVYLCGYFWNAPATGAGSRADTIIHEGTHFPQILGTDDYAYGQSSCKSLAKSNPANAVYNADNYAFFSTNAA